ncbi:iron chelate uptake ABC transporter family permease subunit [Pseudaeromonas sp. ZJS20]|uniref:iron chelate uptake ABC transporter family permease subunit n=1 Tax=Pseudaeromonas aegiceratis TaxID=3153928 RepID=UPI00390C4390
MSPSLPPSLRYSLRPYLWLTGLLGLSLLGSLSLGAVAVSPSALWQAWAPDAAAHFTLLSLRLPRLLLAWLVGAMLGAAGCLCQAVVRNPLAAPDLLGVSHGASLAVVLALVVWPGLAPGWLPWLALTGGLGAAGLLWWLSGPRCPPLRLALTGVALGTLLASGVDLVLLTQPPQLNQALLWLTGSLWGRGWEQLPLLLPWWSLLPLLPWLASRLDLLMLGEERAQGLGLPVARLRGWALLLAVVWCSAAVAVCGPLAFLGLVAPHLARRLVGGRHVRLLPAAMLVGALLLSLADLLGRILHPPLELPAGLFTALLGAPYFLYLLLRTR